MKKILLISGLFLINFLSSQQIKTLLDQGKINEALDILANDEDLTSQDYYYASMLYHQKNSIDESIEYINKAIEKEEDAEYYQFSAFLMNKQGECWKALESLNKLYELDPNNQALLMKAKTYSYCFDEPNYDKAISTYQQVLKSEPNMEAVQGLSLLYSNQSRYKQAHNYLESLIKNKRFNEHKDYIQFINATLYFEEEKYETAENELNELITRDANDYISIAKLIQVYYAQKRYEETDKLRKKLYEGYNNKQLPDFIKEKYQFDQFTVMNTLTVKAYESLANEEDYNTDDKVLYKYIFEVYNNEDEFLYTIQSEYSSAIPTYKKYNLDFNYYLGKTTYVDKYEHFNFGPQKINITSLYPKTKQLVTDIIEGKLVPKKNSKITIDKF